MIIPQDLFVFYSVPYDPNRPWAKQNHEENLDNWIHWNIVKIDNNRWALYRDYWYYFDKEKLTKHYFEWLEGIYESEETARYFADLYRSFYLKNPERIYEERWIRHDLH